MERLFRDADRNVFLILDNQKAHHSHAVKDWLSEHEDPIEVFFLPSYFPKLNPDEYLNYDLKTSAPSGVAARTKDHR
jgi:transposase